MVCKCTAVAAPPPPSYFHCRCGDFGVRLEEFLFACSLFFCFRFSFFPCVVLVGLTSDQTRRSVFACYRRKPCHHYKRSKLPSLLQYGGACYLPKAEKEGGNEVRFSSSTFEEISKVLLDVYTFFFMSGRPTGFLVPVLAGSRRHKEMYRAVYIYIHHYHIIPDVP